jgi:bifunctional DNA-binding transcriptional regulator/antitoxin component of YhaV-PrlF toxin-antitoxin module
VIPADCRSAAGIKPGDEVLIELVGEGEFAAANPPPSRQGRTKHRRTARTQVSRSRGGIDRRAAGRVGVSDPDVVADASAVLALLKDEELGEFDPEHLVGAAISAVNFSEVLAKLGSGGLTEAEADMAVAALDLHVIAFDEH